MPENELREHNRTSAHTVAEVQPYTAVRMKLVGANPVPEITGLNELPGRSNYFIGRDPKKWRTNVPRYARVKYRAVYPGIDLIYYGNQQEVECDFVIAPGAEPRMIKIHFEGSEPQIDPTNGDLVLGIGANELRLHKPVVYQSSAKSAREKHHVDGEYSLDDQGNVSFRLANYDRTQPVILDPVLSYSTYLGGNREDVDLGMAVDSSGSTYVTGQTVSSDFPVTANAMQTSLATDCPLAGSRPLDAFVTKLNPLGSGLVYSTYLGGGCQDFGAGIAVDTSGQAYVTGGTLSADFPTTPGAFSPNCPVLYGACDGQQAFVTKLTADGSSLEYSTFLGQGSGSGIALDSNGDAYVTGFGGSLFPLAPGAIGSALPPTGGAFVTKLNPSGSSLIYSGMLPVGPTVIGGEGIAVDASGNAYMTGVTSATNLPTTPGAFQPHADPSVAIDCPDGFVAKVNPSGTALIFLTYLGGNGCDYPARKVGLDSAGNLYVAGTTTSNAGPGKNSFPTTPGSFQTTPDPIGTDNAFVTKLNATGSSLVYSTFLHRSTADSVNGLAVDSTGHAYVIGYTLSTDFPTFHPFQAFCNGCTGSSGDAFLTELNQAGSGLVYSTYLGGSGNDNGGSVALDSSGDVHLTGVTNSNDFPTANARQTTLGGGYDAFVAKVSPIDAASAVISGPALSHLTATLATLSFGSQPVGLASSPLTLTIRNFGSQPLVVRRIVVAPRLVFPQTNTCGTALAPMRSCSIKVSFTPRVKVTYRGTIIVIDNSRPRPVQFVRLSGTGM